MPSKSYARFIKRSGPLLGLFLLLTGCVYKGNVAYYPVNQIDTIEHVFAGPFLITSEGQVIMPSSELYRPDEIKNKKKEDTPARLVKIDKLSRIVKVVSNEYRTFALKKNGEVWYWGAPLDVVRYGGLVTTFPQVRSARKFPHIEHATNIWGSGIGFVYKKKDGTVWGWKTRFPGTLDNESVNLRHYPWLDNAIDVGELLTELKPDGTVWAVTETGNKKIDGLQNMVAIEEVDMYNHYALDANGRVWTWGKVQATSLPKGEYQSSDSSIFITLPHPIITMDHVVQISDFFALKEDGSVWDLEDLSQLTALHDIKEIGGSTALANDGLVYAASSGDSFEELIP